MSKFHLDRMILIGLSAPAVGGELKKCLKVLGLFEILDEFFFNFSIYACTIRMVYITSPRNKSVKITKPEISSIRYCNLAFHFEVS